MNELKQGEDSIRKLIQNLDAKKDDALQTTFKMVANHFSEVFKTIVPGGEGRLIMKTKDVPVRCLFSDDASSASPIRLLVRSRYFVVNFKLILWQEDEDDEGGGSSSRRAATREYTGIGVEVRFAAGTKVQKMRELSGGQKVPFLICVFARAVECADSI